VSGEPVNDVFTPISSVGEFGLIERINQRLGPPQSPHVSLGIGDDAAVLIPPEGERLLVTTDLLIEHVHFDRTYTPFRHLGYKSISSNVSDVAAMGGRPHAATVGLGIPNSVSVEMMDAFVEGLADASARYGIDVVGGDISGAHKLLVSITLLGSARDEDLVYRDGASPGDVLCVTGTLGGSYAGLRILQKNKERMLASGPEFRPDLERHAFVIQRHLRPDARMDAIAALRAAGVRPTAMIDISDGLASEIRHLCTRSGCSARIEASRIPVDDRTRAAALELEESALDYVLYGGEEYELLFTIRQDDLDDLMELDLDVTAIGTCSQGGKLPEIVTTSGDVQPLMAEGFRHF